MADIDLLDLKAISARCQYSSMAEPGDAPDAGFWELKFRIEENFESRRFLLLGIQLLDKDKTRLGGKVLIYESHKGRWAFLQDFFVGNAGMQRLSVEDFTEGGNPVLVAEGGNGNHGLEMSVFKLEEKEFKTILSIDGYGCGPEVTILDKERVIIDHIPTLEGVCEACRACQGRVYRWKAGKFEIDPDEYLDARKKVLGSYNYETYDKNMLELLRPFADKHSEHFDAQQNVAYFLRHSGQVEQAKPYVKAMAAITLAEGKFECSYCDSRGNENREKARGR